MKNVLLVLLIFISFIFNNLSAQSNPLDTTFNATGKVISAFGNSRDIPYSVKLQPDGKIVIGGISVVGQYDKFAIVRFKSNGILDTDFGTEGKVITSIGTSNDLLYKILLQPDGKIIAVGSSVVNSSLVQIALARYNNDGSLDDSFGIGGTITTSFGDKSCFGYAAALQPDGNIMVAGQTMIGNEYKVCVLRYLSDGTLDDSFNNNGILIDTTNAGEAFTSDIAVQQDGKILVTGSLSIDYKNNFRTIRLTPDGMFDASFGNMGQVITKVDSEESSAFTMVIQPDGKIVVAGDVAYNFSDITLAMARYFPDGSLDSTFGGDGSFATSLGLTFSYCYANAVSVLPDGKILVGLYGYYNSPTPDADFVLMRFRSDGTRDSGFGINGVVKTSFGPTPDLLYDLAVQPDGKIVAVGETQIDNIQKIALARYLQSLAVGVLDFSVQDNAVFIYPNPVAQGATLQYTLKDPANMSIQLFDMQGKIVTTFLNTEKQEVGNHEINLRFPEGLVAGNYVLKLSSDLGSVGIKIVR